MARPIDGEVYMELLKEQYLHHEAMGNKQMAKAWQGAMQLLYDMPTLTPPNEWVSVEERLPEPGERVLAANGSFVGEAYMASNGAWMRHDGFPWEVDAWMPMPDRRPPEGETAPYGFISPDGEFHPVKWADHERFAGDYIRAHDGWENVLKNDMHTGTDYLVLVKGWLLLHNPRQGVPFLTSGDRPMTKAQREALFDYYTKYGMKKEASALYQEVEV